MYTLRIVLCIHRASLYIYLIPARCVYVIFFFFLFNSAFISTVILSIQYENRADFFFIILYLVRLIIVRNIFMPVWMMYGASMYHKSELLTTEQSEVGCNRETRSKTVLDQSNCFSAHFSIPADLRMFSR